MTLIEVKLIGGAYTALQKQEIVERLTEAMVEVTGECTRRLTWCVVDEVPSGQWAIGGQTLTVDDFRALACADVDDEEPR